MAEYINREDAKKSLIGWDTDPTDEEIEYALDNIPAADVVEVVRCKNCKHFCKDLNDESCGICDVETSCCVTVDVNDFCSYGERRSDE